MTSKLTDEEVAALEGLAKPFGKGDLADDIKASLYAKGMISSGGPGVVSVTSAGKRAVRKK